jgi:hypothetical protein
MPRRSRVGGIDCNICIKTNHSSEVLIMAKSVPILLRHQRLSQIKRWRNLPDLPAFPTRRMMSNDLFQPTSHYLGKTHLILRSQSLGFAEKAIRDLNLRFYHYGDLPHLSEIVNSISNWNGLRKTPQPPVGQPVLRRLRAPSQSRPTQHPHRTNAERHAFPIFQNITTAYQNRHSPPIEYGDQGKNRFPHDHNRDYEGDLIYVSVKAIK